jgi:hypothetical protein
VYVGGKGKLEKRKSPVLSCFEKGGKHRGEKKRVVAVVGGLGRRKVAKDRGYEIWIILQVMGQAVSV